LIGCALSDTTASTSVTRTGNTSDASGWTTSSVLVVKRTSRSADTRDGEDTTAATHRMSPYRAMLMPHSSTQVYRKLQATNIKF